MSDACAITDSRSPRVRSRVSNGKELFLEAVDGRSVLARRFRDIFAQLVSDLGGDPSEAQSIIARRASTLAVWCEQAESGVARGEKLDIGEFTTATNTLRRLLLVAQGTSRDFNPSLPQSVIDRAMERDPAAASAEYLGIFRTDVERFITRDAVQACVNVGVHERMPERAHSYIAFVDPSGGTRTP